MRGIILSVIKNKKATTAAALCLAVVLFFCSCGIYKGDDEKSEKQLFAMDTVIELTSYGKNSEAALEKAAEKIKELEKELSTTEENSAVNKINTANGKAVAVSGNVLVPLRASLDISEKSGGALDVTVYPVVKAWGFISKDYRVPEEIELMRLLDKVNYKNITVGDTGVVVPSGVEIDLGSVAKGYASQVVCEMLKESGVEGAVVSLGGNVQTVGRKPDGSKWRVAICDPDNPDGGITGTLTVGEAAVVTSGGYQRFFERDGKKYHHIIDPSTGNPADSGLKSVTIVCPDGTYADGLSTALFVLGLEKAMDYHEKYGGFEAVFVSDDGTVTVTDGLKDSFAPS